MQEYVDQLRNVTALIRSCTQRRDLATGASIHADVDRLGWLNKSLHLGNTLVSMYAKCGALVKAQQLCDTLPVRDVVSWNSLISGYAQQGYGEEAIKCFERMQVDGMSPNSISFVCILKACGSIRAACRGEEIHAVIAKLQLLDDDVVLGTALVDMYAKCGLVAKAQKAFDKLLVRNTISWNALISGYSQHDLADQALDCYEHMQYEGFPADAVTYSCTLNACSNLEAVSTGQEKHGEVVMKGLLDENHIICSALVDMYAKSGLVTEAQDVFDRFSFRDVAMWNALITGHCQNGNFLQALNCFEQMKSEGYFADATTFVFVVKACGMIGASHIMQEFYDDSTFKILLKNHVALGNVLIEMHAKCSQLRKARDLFDKLPVRDESSWNSLIGGYVEGGHGEEALNCFDRMHSDGVCPGAITFVFALKACSSTRDFCKGQKIHDKIMEEGLLVKDPIVGTALVDMYVRCGFLGKAEDVFEKLLVRDAVCWNVLLEGCAQYEHDEEALLFFEQMELEGISPNKCTFICILKVCGNLGALHMGQLIHEKVLGKGSLEREISVRTALIDMYGKCGLLPKAEEVFERYPDRDVVLWNALITGYALLGRIETVFLSFNKMIREGIKADVATFTLVLSVCSHSGALNHALIIFDNMCSCHGLFPGLEQYACMVDLFGRSGLLDNAIAIVKEMPFSANSVVWHSLLGACRKWGNIRMGGRVFEQSVQSDELDAASYVCMSNIHADALI